MRLLYKEAINITYLGAYLPYLRLMPSFEIDRNFIIL